MRRVMKVTVPGNLGALSIDMPADADIFKIIGSGPNVIMWYTTDPLDAVDDVPNLIRTRRFHIVADEILPAARGAAGMRKRYMDSVPIVMEKVQTVVRHVWEIDPPKDQQDLEREILELRRSNAELITIVRGTSQIVTDLVDRVKELEDYVEINVETDGI